MLEFMLAAPHSGSGKTVMTCALLMALKRRGLAPCAFKCGPDYIDPMFHRAVLGVESHNLDLFLAESHAVRALYAAQTQGHGAAVCEAAMGFYDGLGGTERASAWQVAETLDLPVLLVLRPKGASLTLAATVCGLRDFRQNSHVAGILLNDCSAALYAHLAPMLLRETGLPVLGYLPHTEDAAFESRHLGLCTAGEVQNLAARMGRLAQQAEQSVELDEVVRLCSRRDVARVSGLQAQNAFAQSAAFRAPRVRIAVAEDAAFCFAYAETGEALCAAGAETVSFSPLRDAALPQNVDALYLPGGYPELYARQLSQNEAMRAQICAAVRGGLPTVAECGGFLYLGRSLQDADGAVWPMAGVLPGHGVKTARLVRFGYAELSAAEDSLLLRAGETVPVHEFHYWDSDENGTAFAVKKPLGAKGWRCGFASENLYAAFPHLYFAGAAPLAQRFVQAAQKHKAERLTGAGAAGESDRP